MKRLICLSLLITALHLQAATTTVWEGSKTFSLWSDVLNIAGSKFSKVQADDVVLFSITANAGAQLQVSYGSSLPRGVEEPPSTMATLPTSGSSSSTRKVSSAAKQQINQSILLFYLL